MNQKLKTKELIFSGVQPTGNLHLGNYLGAIKNWIELQKKSECMFCIVDLHAITTTEGRENLKDNSREVAAAYLASGVDPKKSIIFVQSSVTGHAELSWTLSCFTPIGWLNRMTQFKDKAGKNKEKAPLGLYSYPVLMAADILLYKSTHVPVGDDQKQHLELARDIAQAFNRFFDTDYFPVPEPVIMGNATRIMSLRDGTKKMSKSDLSDFSRINMTDDADLIRKKIMKARTDSFPFPETKENLESRPEIQNLVKIFMSLEDTNLDKIINDYRGKELKIFKEDLFDSLESKISKITKEMSKLLDDNEYLDKILKDGSTKANLISKKNIEDIHKLIGFYKS